jgi:hypothetical protein
MVNTFTNAYLQIYYACFTKNRISKQSHFNQWLTTGIKTSCKKKRELYLLIKLHGNNNLKQYYIKYSKTLAKVITETKNLATMIKLQTPITLKITWHIIRVELGKNRLMDKNCKTGKINPSIINNYF